MTGNDLEERGEQDRQRTSRRELNLAHHERSCAICRRTNHKAIGDDGINFFYLHFYSMVETGFHTQWSDLRRKKEHVRNYPGQRCSTADLSSPGCSCSSGLCERWPVCPQCQRSPCAGAPARWLLTPPCAVHLPSPQQHAAGSRRVSRSRGSVWWATAEC